MGFLERLTDFGPPRGSAYVGEWQAFLAATGQAELTLLGMKAQHASVDELVLALLVIGVNTFARRDECVDVWRDLQRSGWTHKSASQIANNCARGRMLHDMVQKLAAARGQDVVSLGRELLEAFPWLVGRRPKQRVYDHTAPEEWFNADALQLRQELAKGFGDFLTLARSKLTEGIRRCGGEWNGVTLRDLAEMSEAEIRELVGPQVAAVWDAELRDDS